MTYFGPHQKVKALDPICFVPIARLSGGPKRTNGRLGAIRPHLLRQDNMSAEMAAHAAAGAGPAASLPQEQQQHAAQLDAASIKLTRGTSCVLCQQRKVRCDKNKPCANCVKAGVECRIVPPQPPRRRKKRLQEKDLIERLKKYEILLSEHGVKFDAITPDLRGDGSQLDDVDELENDFEGLKTTPEASSSPGNASQADQQYVILCHCPCFPC